MSNRLKSAGSAGASSSRASSRQPKDKEKLPLALVWNLIGKYDTGAPTPSIEYKLRNDDSQEKQTKTSLKTLIYQNLLPELLSIFDEETVKLLPDTNGLQLIKLINQLNSSNDGLKLDIFGEVIQDIKELSKNHEILKALDKTLQAKIKLAVKKIEELIITDEYNPINQKQCDAYKANYKLLAELVSDYIFEDFKDSFEIDDPKKYVAKSQNTADIEKQLNILINLAQFLRSLQKDPTKIPRNLLNKINNKKYLEDTLNVTKITVEHIKIFITNGEQPTKGIETYQNIKVLEYIFEKGVHTQNTKINDDKKKAIEALVCKMRNNLDVKNLSKTGNAKNKTSKTPQTNPTATPKISNQFVAKWMKQHGIK